MKRPTAQLTQPKSKPVPPLALAAFAMTATCSGSHGASIVLPSFSNVSDAPAVIQQAAQAVVRVAIAGALATGSFISPDGILITNNHVLGVGVCPIEGCHIELTFDYQIGQPVQSPETVFVVPLAVDVGLDMAVVQVYSDAGGAPLQTPNYVTLASHTPASLLGVHVNVVGHPEGHLKKWTQGQIVDSDGTWIYFSAYALPGNSGSPLLDDDGHMVGILSMGPTSQDLISSEGVSEYSIGTASAALLGAMSEPFPPSMWSVAAPTSDDGVVQHDLVYLNAQAPNANVDGVSKPVLTSLGAACDAALAVQDYASVDDLAAGLMPCTDAELWIQCNSFPTQPSYAVCPPDPSDWSTRYQSIFNRYLALNGLLSLNEVSFAPAALATTNTAAISQGASTLQQALLVAQAPIDFNVSNYLAAFGVTSYAGQNLVDYVQNYASVPDYPLQATSIASTALWLLSDGAMDRSTVLSLLQTLASDPSVDVGTKLYIEDIQYQAGVLQ